VEQVFSAGFGYSEAPLLHKDGRQVPYFFTGRKVVLDGSLYFLGVGIDVSDRKRVEEERESLQSQLLQAQKMESVGRLAGGVAHDFNNMLGVIIGYAELALLQSRPEEPLKYHLEQIRNAAERSAALTQQLLAFARRQTIAPKILDLNDTVSGMLSMLRRLIGEEVELSWLPGARLWRVLMDPTQIDQILVNLCVNAQDSMERGGKITIETANITFDQTYCAVHEGFSPGDHVSLIVSDTGCGMDRETIKGIFEPFFTTKEQGKGTGLGLATVYGIVKQNNASINVYSEPGKGTTFKIYLPRVIGQGDEAEAEGIGKLPLSRGETILIVEDEKTIMEMARTMLTALHYDVLVASDPEEALRLAENREQAIDLLLTDVVMPRMNGRQLQERLVTFRPELPCLFMSGYTADVIAHQGVLDEGLFFIQKPFSLQTLATRVRDVLDQV
jgi:two-component system, cell cycle sensor histidine kinase and response regulator CckA